MQNNLENLRISLIEDTKFNLHDAFRVTKCSNNNLISIDKPTLQLFLERNGQPLPISYNDLCSIMCRYDLDGDDCLNFKEFQMAVIPS